MHGYITAETNIIYWRKSLTILKMAMLLAAMICTSPGIMTINTCVGRGKGEIFSLNGRMGGHPELH